MEPVDQQTELTPVNSNSQEATIALEKIGGEHAGRLLAGYLHFSDEGIRRKAATAVGNNGDTSTLPHLIALFNNEPEMRVQLAPILAHIGGEGVIDVLEEKLRTGQNRS